MGARYEIIVYWSDEDDSFWSKSRSFPGCMADGDTRRNAVANAERVMAEWISVAKSEGRILPKPKRRSLTLS